MPNLTNEQAQQLADNYSASATAISDYLDKNRPVMSTEQRDAMSARIRAMVDIAYDVRNAATLLALQDAVSALSGVEKITANLTSTYQQLKNIQKAIDIAAIVITLGAAIVAKDPAAVVKAIGDLLSGTEKEE